MEDGGPVKQFRIEDGEKWRIIWEKEEKQVRKIPLDCL